MNNEPLIFFVHIPKTAGSTVNHYMEKYLGPGFAHCESFIENEQELRRKIREAKWMSGHVHYAKAKPLLEKATDREIKYYSCIRDPLDQVLSHFNWLIEIHKKGPKFFFRHPAPIQEISLDIISSNLENKYKIMHLLIKYRGLFLNCQSKFIVPYEKNIHIDAVHRFVENEEYKKLFRYIGNEKTLSTLLKNMGIPEVQKLKKKNSAKYHISKEKLQKDKEFKSFIAIHNKFDYLVYDNIKF